METACCSRAVVAEEKWAGRVVHGRDIRFNICCGGGDGEIDLGCCRCAVDEGLQHATGNDDVADKGEGLHRSGKREDWVDGQVRRGL